MKEYNLGRAPIGLANDRTNWWSIDPIAELDALGFEYGPQRTKNQKNAASNSWQHGHSDVAADILGVLGEAYSAHRCGFDPHSITYVYPSAPSGLEADFGGVYEVKRTNDWCGDLKYRVNTNANHFIIHVWIERDYDRATESLTIKKVHLIGWNHPELDAEFSRHAGYDNRGEEMRFIPVTRRRPMNTLPLPHVVSDAA